MVASLGDFKGVVPSKIGDRIGLAFSTSSPVVELAMDDIIAIPEVIRNDYIFSDGCGVMGIGIAEMVLEALDLPGRYSDLPGAIQIRLGGCKGMLSLKEDFPRNKIGIRPSMVKFPSNHRILEVKKIAKAKDSRQGHYENYLWGQGLIVIDSLGVPDHVFLGMQQRDIVKRIISGLTAKERDQLSVFNV